MRKLRTFLLSGLAIGIFTAVSLAQAQTPAVNPAPSGGGIQKIYDQLDLSDTQKKELEANKTQHRAKMKVLREELKPLRQAFQQELMKPQLDIDMVNDLHTRIKALESQVSDEKFTSFMTVRSILTQQQFLEFKALIRKHKRENAQTQPPQAP